MRISDWSSDVCSSDLAAPHRRAPRFARQPDPHPRPAGDAGRRRAPHPHLRRDHPRPGVPARRRDRALRRHRARRRAGPRAARPGRGVLLFGSHLGSFEVLRVIARQRPDYRIRVVLDKAHSPAMTRLLDSLNPEIAAGVIDAGQDGPSLMLAIKQAADEGALIALLVDRTQPGAATQPARSEEHTSELQSLMRISYAVFCLNKKKHTT